MMRRSFCLCVAAVIVFSSCGWSRGVLCLTFDDTHFDSWTNALPLFLQYKAHASFFPSGMMDDEDLAKLKTLSLYGHSIGVHSVNHCNVPQLLSRKWFPSFRFLLFEIYPQTRTLSSVGINVKAFAYPFGAHSRQTDIVLARKFTRLRGAEFRNYITNGLALSKIDRAFLPVSNLSSRVYLPAVAIGEQYQTDIIDICNALYRCRDNDECLVLFSHDIASDAEGINMKTEWLMLLLDTASKLGVSIKGVDEL